jgi:predicted flap endonuclease-1-like 5' DNA nuclease
MFKDYKEVFKVLHNLQDKLWQDSMASFPGTFYSRGIGGMQKETLNQVSSLLEQAITQSLDMQREWVSQWSDRASSKKVKPDVFAELSAEARRSTERWLENQNQLWNQWLNIVGDGGDQGRLPGFDEWEKAVQESMQAQTAVMKDWEEMTNFKKLSGKEFTKLSNHIVKALDKSLSTQQRLWRHWFDQMQVAGKATVPVTTEKKHTTASQQAAPAAQKDKAKPRTRKAATETAADDDDLKQIDGIGPGLEKKLKDSGITTLKALAALDDHDIARLEKDVIRFSGRIKRDKWVEQARKLTS